jgi:creatinine amidohydrolase
VNTSRLYEQQTWEEVADAAERGAGVILPLGAIEQHGPHLPLDTDSFLARELALAGSAGHDALVAPVVSYGYRSRPLSGGGPTFPGTLSLSGSTFVALVREILEGLLEHGFRRLLVYGWHMENQNFAYEAAYLAAGGRDRVKLVVMEAPFDSLSAETMRVLYDGEFPGWPAEHASIMETSLMLHLRPELVDMTKAVDDRVGKEPSYDVIPPPPEMTTRSGILFKATRGTAEKGARAFAEITVHLAHVLDAEFPELAREQTRSL